MDRKITLIRHGMTAGNLEKRYIGVTDEPLCETGVSEVSKRSYPAADIVIISPLLRCKMTAELIYPNRDFIVIDDLKETDFGDFEGKNYTELSSNEDYQRWIDSGGELPFPNGESKEIANKRALRGFEEVLSLTENYSNVSIVTHGGTIMAILSYYFGENYYSYYVKNGEGYTFDLSHDGIFSGLHFRSFLG